MEKNKMSLQKTVIKRLTPQKLKSSLLGLPLRVKKERWSLSWDKLTDSLYLTPTKIPKGNILFGMTKELNIYVNSKSEINGIFVENFSANFVKHNKEFENLLDVLDKEVNDGIFTPTDKKKSELYASALETSLLETIGDKKQLLHPNFLGA